jgi:uncharacterized membrane protein YphA (DoxX/SURF4 family)
MTHTMEAPRDTTASSAPIADIVALIASLAILIAYAVLPLRTDGSPTGFNFNDSSTTFPALTLLVGAVGVVSAIACIVGIRERGVRWWFAGLGLIGLVFLVDNSLQGKAALASGGLLAMLGAAALIVQAGIPRPQEVAANRTNDTILGLIRVLLGGLWFTQLLWKLPWNNFGCKAGALVPAANTSGLCDWIGKEIASPRWPAYKSFLDGMVTPNLGWLAFLIVAGEAFVCVSLLFGLFTRFGALSGVVMGLNLFIGLTAVPGEWDWTYLMLPALCAVYIAVGGRWVGLDTLLYPQLKKLAETGNPLGRLLVLLV